MFAEIFQKDSFRNKIEKGQNKTKQSAYICMNIAHSSLEIRILESYLKNVISKFSFPNTFL